MDALVTMSAPTLAAAPTSRMSVVAQQHGPRHQTISVCSSPTIGGSANSSSNATGARVSYPHKEAAVAAAGATVFIAGSVPDVPIAVRPSSSRVPEVQPTDGSRAVVSSQTHHQQQSGTGNHVVKIKINPDASSEVAKAPPKLYSAVRINLEDDSCDLDTSKSAFNSSGTNSVVVYANNSNGITGDQVDGHDLGNLHNGDGVHQAKLITLVENEPCVTISVRNNGCDYSGSESSSEEFNQNHVTSPKDPEMVQQRTVAPSSESSRASSSCFYYSSPLSTMVMSSGQCSPSETLDSGTCSDLDGTPPPLPKKKSSSSSVVVGSTATATTPTATNHDHHPEQRHDRTGSLTSSGAEVDSDDNESSISCDSLNSGELPLSSNNANTAPKFRTPRSLKQRAAVKQQLKKKEQQQEEDEAENEKSSRQRKSSKSEVEEEVVSPSVTTTLPKASTTPKILLNGPSSPLISECTYEERCRRKEKVVDVQPVIKGLKYVYEDDRHYKFHVSEHAEVAACQSARDKARSSLGGAGVEDEYYDEEESFPGYKILEKEAIRSAKGTVRGAKNRVRTLIATFLQKPSTKDYKAKDAGKVVVYTTTMGIVRETYYRCELVKKILRTHMVKYEERDMYMSTESQTELRDRIGCTAIQVPQLFIDGQYIGDADMVERLNETGELRLMLKPYKSLDACSTCQACGGYRLLPCPVCNGSKKSVHRNDFTAEFIALKCMNCDEVGLVRCPNC